MVDEPIVTVAAAKVQAPAPAQALNATLAMPFASVGEPPGTDTVCPLRIACPAVGAPSEKALGGGWSTVKPSEDGVSTPFKLSFARICTVYPPSAGKLDAGKAYAQLERPLARTN